MAAPWIFGAVAFVPLIFVGWLAVSYLRNAPFWDEFNTVLDFLSNYQRTDSWRGLGRLLFEPNNGHLIVTSRLIFIAMWKLTGGINFVHLAVLGNLFIAAAIAVIAWQQRGLPARLFMAATLSLLVFQLQHYENLFLSYASIDHFHVVLLSSASLALLVRQGRWTGAGALALAGLAAFTLTHGLAVFPAGAIMLGAQRRWRRLACWSAGALVIAGLFLAGFPSLDHTVPAFSSVKDLGRLVFFWLTVLGGVPALGSGLAGPLLGALALAGLCGLVYRGAFRREPYLCALAACVLFSTLAIACGRFGLAGVSALSSRYLVQSAVLWAVLCMLGLKAIGGSRALVSGGLVLLPVLAGLSVAADLRFFREARSFADRRAAVTRYYDKTGTFKNAPYAIFPKPQLADKILTTARQDALFRLQPRSAPEMSITVPAEETPLASSIDEITVGLTHVHIRGWLLPPTEHETEFDVCLILKEGDDKTVFRGQREARPDVADTFQRPDADRCGFYFIVPRSALPHGTLDMSLALVGPTRALVTSTGRQFANRRILPMAADAAPREAATAD